MTHRLHKPAARPAGAISTAGLLLSLAGTLDQPHGPLARRAKAVAHALMAGDTDHDTAAALLCQLLDACDAGLALDDDGLLDSGFDA